MNYKKGSHEYLPSLLTRFQPSWLISKIYGFPLMTALVLVRVVVIMSMFMAMLLYHMLVFMTIVRMGHLPVLMLMFMLIFVMAAHLSSPPFHRLLYH